MRHPRSPVLNLHFSTLLSLIDRPTWRSYFSTDPFLYNFNYSTYFCIRPKIRELYPDFNIGISTPIREESDRWFQIYRHWSFKPKHHTRNLTRTKRAKNGSSRISGAWIFRKVLNLQHENCRCNMDVPSRWLERTVRDSPVRTN